MARDTPLALLLFLAALAPASVGALADGPDRMVVVRCSDIPAPAVAPPIDLSCPAAIRPGSPSNMCTLNFVVTDGVELYIGAAGHCAGVGGRLGIPGIPGTLGTVVFRRSALLDGDWAFIRIDPEDRVRVEPTMCRFAGPTSGPLGNVRTPLPGELALHYGHGVAMGSTEETRGRAGPVVATVLSDQTFVIASNAAGGDSGSPVRLATGEAAGILIAVALAPGYEPNLVVASRFEQAMAGLAAFLGRPVTLVEGDPLPDVGV